MGAGALAAQRLPVGAHQNEIVDELAHTRLQDYVAGLLERYTGPSGSIDERIFWRVIRDESDLNLTDDEIEFLSRARSRHGTDDVDNGMDDSKEADEDRSRSRRRVINCAEAAQAAPQLLVEAYASLRSDGSNDICTWVDEAGFEVRYNKRLATAHVRQIRDFTSPGQSGNCDEKRRADLRSDSNADASTFVRLSEAKLVEVDTTEATAVYTPTALGASDVPIAPAVEAPIANSSPASPVKLFVSDQSSSPWSTSAPSSASAASAAVNWSRTSSR